jgi:hypothetical protein
VICGEAGIGKSALLEYATANTQGRVLRVAGVQPEADLPFAALHVLLRPVLDRVPSLPPQQSDALLGALGLCGTSGGDRFLGDRILVGLATLSLLVEVSATRPLVCLIDDATGWTANRRRIAVRGTRLDAEPVVVLFATREVEGGIFGRGLLPELRLGRLDADAAGRLVAEHAADLPAAVRDQLIAEAQGNPLALMELPSMLTPERRLGGHGPLSFSFVPVRPVDELHGHTGERLHVT